MNDIHIFLDQDHFINTKPEGSYEIMQLGSQIMCISHKDFDIQKADFVLVGCPEWSGVDKKLGYGNSADMVRAELYKMYYWHNNVKIADIGNVKQGATPKDTRYALLTTLQEIHAAGKIAVLLGGGHDLMMQQYEVYKKAEKVAVATVADMLIDLDETEEINASGFLMDMLTSAPNFISHYSHIGFQSYYTHPQMLETLDKLRFDFYRLGKVRESIEEMEPVLRISNIFGLDMSVVRYGDSPANVHGSPNGLSGEEVCMLTRYAGMSDQLTSFGIFGYNEMNDSNNMTAKLIAQMLWYYIDGCHVRKTESRLIDTEEFISFNVIFSDIDTVFMKSKRTKRWWMGLPSGNFVPCSYNDYLIACRGEIPERWLREQERLA